MHAAYPDAVLLPESDEPGPGRHRRARRLRRRLLPRHPRGAQRAVQQRRRRHAVLAARARALLLRRRRATGAADLDVFLRLWDEHHAGRRRRPAGRAGLGRPRLLPARARHRGRRSSSARRSRSCSPGARCPSIYYGDEIGMRYLPGLPDIEGSDLRPRLQPRRLPHPDAVGRRPAQRRLLHRAAPTALYLPQDPDAGPARPSPAQLDDPTRHCTGCRRLIRLRRDTPALRTAAADHGAQPRLPADVPARGRPPGRGQPAPRAGLGPGARAEGRGAGPWRSAEPRVDDGHRPRRRLRLRDLPAHPSTAHPSRLTPRRPTPTAAES